MPTKKQLEAYWSSTADGILPTDATPEQRRLARRCFYSGIAGTLHIIKTGTTKRKFAGAVAVAATAGGAIAPSTAAAIETLSGVIETLEDIREELLWYRGLMNRNED